VCIIDMRPTFGGFLFVRKIPISLCTSMQCFSSIESTQWWVTLWRDGGVDWCCRITLQQDDPRWVGAWWVAYMAVMVGILLIAPVFFGYPPQPSTSSYIVHHSLLTQQWILYIHASASVRLFVELQRVCLCREAELVILSKSSWPAVNSRPTRSRCLWTIDRGQVTTDQRCVHVHGALRRLWCHHCQWIHCVRSKVFPTTVRPDRVCRRHSHRPVIHHQRHLVSKCHKHTVYCHAVFID